MTEYRLRNCPTCGLVYGNGWLHCPVCGSETELYAVVYSEIEDIWDDDIIDEIWGDDDGTL